MKSAASIRLLPAGMLLPFILVTSLFALWGFANDITNPLVKAFKDIFVISNAQSSLVQTAFYGGYATMALPAAIFIRRFSYKAGILVGLALYALGAFIAIPAAAGANFNLFLVALYVLTFGLAFLETTANPYILSMGPAETATRRLNLAQAFNPIGSLSGMVVASFFILGSLQVEDIRSDVSAHVEAVQAGEPAAGVDPDLTDYLTARAGTSEAIAEAGDLFSSTLADFQTGALTQHDGRSFAEMQQHDLTIIRTPYVVIGLIVVAMMIVFFVTKMPDTGGDREKSLNLGPVFKRLIVNKRYVEGVIAQAFYVGAQIMCWTFIIHYATTNLGLSAASAQNYNILAMGIFCVSRFICTFILRFFSPGKLLFALSIAAGIATLGAIFAPGFAGLYSLIAISACMSLMFPTIYGIALDGMGDDAKLASAGLIFAIVGGALMPPLQGTLIDLGGPDGILFGLPAVSASFVLPLLCFVVIATYGWRTFTIHHERAEAVTI